MFKKNKGQSLLEVLIALSVIILVLTALVKVVTLSIRSTDYARNSSVATTYATEAMEKIRSFRDANSWTAFSSIQDATGKLFGSNIISFQDYASSSNCTGSASEFDSYKNFLLEGNYLRCVTANKNYTGADVTSIKMTVSVYWIESDPTPKKAEIVSYFYNWK